MTKLANLSVSLLLTLTLYAQTETEVTWVQGDIARRPDANDFLISLQVGVPSREMRPAIRNQMGNIGFGGGFLMVSDPAAWGKNRRESALRLGGSVGYTYYGRFKSDINITGSERGLKTDYGLYDLKAIARFRPQLHRAISPFADIQAGMDIYRSSTHEDLDELDSIGGEEADELASTSSSCFTKGVGGGIIIGRGGPRRAKLVIRVLYNWGGVIKYMVRDSLEYNYIEDTFTYETGRAPVRYVMIYVGIGL